MFQHTKSPLEGYTQYLLNKITNKKNDSQGTIFIHLHNLSSAFFLIFHQLRIHDILRAPNCEARAPPTTVARGPFSGALGGAMVPRGAAARGVAWLVKPAKDHRVYSTKNKQ